MCRVVAIRQIEECLDGTTIKEFDLDTPLDEPLMRQIVEDGKLRYYPEFPRPYFRIDRIDGAVIQGVFGTSTLRIVFPQGSLSEFEESLQLNIEKGEHCGC